MKKIKISEKLNKKSEEKYQKENKNSKEKKSKIKIKQNQKKLLKWIHIQAAIYTYIL